MTIKTPIWRFFHSDGTKYKSDKYHDNAWCCACLENQVRNLQTEHAIQVQEGRDVDDVPASLDYWKTQAKARISPLCGKVDLLKKHIFKQCPLVTAQEKQEMAAELNSHVPARRNHIPLLHSSEAWDENTPLPPIRLPASPYGLPTYLQSRSLSPLATRPNNVEPDTPLPAARRLRTSYSTGAIAPPSSSAPPKSFDTSLQQDFGEDLCKLLTTCNLSFNLVNTPEFRFFVQKWIPGAHIPDRRALSGPILKGEVEKVVQRNKKAMGKNPATYQADGWKNIAKDSVITSMLLVRFKPFLLRTHNMRGRPKTGDEFFKLFKEDFLYIKETYDVELVAVVTDDGPDGKKMRRLVREDLELRLAAFECWAHQSSLITGNYFGLREPFMEAAGIANEIIKWFNNHQKALDLLRNQQLRDLGKTLALLLAVVTRWTSQYTSFARLIKLKATIISCVANFKDRLLVAAGTENEAQRKAAEIVDRCFDQRFWKNLEKIVYHIKPLAIAANIFQAPSCRLDHVILTLANLFKFFADLPEADKNVTTGVHKSLERRWGKTDQELFILAVFFNPFVRARYFKKESITKMGLFQIARRAYERFFGKSAQGDESFLTSFNDYYNEEGEFSSQSLNLEMFADLYKTKLDTSRDAACDSLDVWDIWNWLRDGDSRVGRSAFVLLAVRILSIVPNSASTECTFSVFGGIHTKRRNRLHSDTVHNSYMVQMDRRRFHAQFSTIPMRKKRNFDSMAGAEEPPTTTAQILQQDNEEDEQGGRSNQDILRSLIDEADFDEDEGEDDDDEDDDLPPAPFITPLARVAGPEPSISSRRVVAYKRIKLIDLFDYTLQEPDSDGGLKFHWKMGLARIQAEEEHLDALQGI